MDYKVDFDALDEFYHGVNNVSNVWSATLSETAKKINALKYSDSISGQAADSIKQYFDCVHIFVISNLAKLIWLNSKNCSKYVSDYYKSIDENLHARIYESEITHYHENLLRNQKKARLIDKDAMRVVSGVSDILQISKTRFEFIDGAYYFSAEHLEQLDDEIKMLESRHAKSDFVETTRTINAIKKVILTYSKYNRKFMSQFDAESFHASDGFLELASAMSELNNLISENSDLFDSADEVLQLREEAIAVEFEERKKKAEAIKMLTIIAAEIACVVAVAAITVGSGGTMAPAAAAAVSGIKGVVVSGIENLSDQYAEKGNLIENYEEVSMMNFVAEAVVGGTVGAISGYAGQWTSNAVKLALPGESSMVASVAKGVVKRATKTALDTGDLGEAFAEGLSGEELVKDAVTDWIGDGNKAVEKPIEVTIKSVESIYDYNENVHGYDAAEELRRKQPYYTESIYSSG